MSARAKREYMEAIYQRYRRAKRAEKRQILDEVCHVAAYHRKSAVSGRPILSHQGRGS